MSASTALEGIQIVDFSRLLPGPLATHLLAQMGARVTKVESPKRTDFARIGLNQVDGASVLYHQLNHQKEELLVDYLSDEGRRQVEELIQKADILVEQFRPGAMEAWGYGYEAVKAINPKIIYVSLTGYGQSGSYTNKAGHDFNYLALSGIMSLLKDDSGKPVVPDTQFADISGSYMTVMAVQAALIKRYQTGEGSRVDVSVAHSILPFLAVPYSLSSTGLDHRMFNIINGKTTVNYAAYACKDGKWLSVGALEIKFWNNLCEVVGKPDWKRHTQLELTTAAFPKEDVEALFRSRERSEWLELFDGLDVCVEPILELNELEIHPLHRNGQSFDSFQTQGGETLKVPALPFKMQ